MPALPLGFGALYNRIGACITTLLRLRSLVRLLRLPFFLGGTHV